MRHLWLLSFLAICVTAGCQSAPTRPPEPKVPNGSQLAVIRFRDCVIKDEVGCDGSGYDVATVVARGLNDPPLLQATVVARPVGSKDELSDTAAVAYGKSEGYDYVVNGEVQDFHRAMIASMDEQRAGIMVRVLKISDGHVVDSYNCRIHFDNLTPLNWIFEDMTEDLRDSLEDAYRNAFTHFMISGRTYRQGCEDTSDRNTSK
jgi:hypothetical protein